MAVGITGTFADTELQQSDRCCPAGFLSPAKRGNRRGCLDCYEVARWSVKLTKTKTISGAWRNPSTAFLL